MRKSADFLIVGAQKSGTTSLWHWLSDHPECFMAKVKEPHFFASFDPTPTLLKKGWFIRDPFAYSELFQDASDNQICGEASPSYLFDKDSAEKIFKANPKTKIIIGLRDPLERAYSEYLMYTIAGIEKRDFFTAISEDKNKNKIDWNDHPLYFELSSYGTQVERYLKYFPREQIYFLTNADLNKNTKNEMQKLSRFLKISEYFWQDYIFSRKNVGAEPTNQIARMLLGSKFFRSVGRLMVPFKFRSVVSKALFGKGDKKKVFSLQERSIFWQHIGSEIRKLEDVSGMSFPSLWKTSPDE